MDTPQSWKAKKRRSSLGEPRGQLFVSFAFCCLVQLRELNSGHTDSSGHTDPDCPSYRDVIDFGQEINLRDCPS